MQRNLNLEVSCPVFIHPQLCRISTDFSDFFERMEKYGEAVSFFTQDPEFKVTLLAGIGRAQMAQIETKRFRHLKVIRIADPTSNFLFFSFLAKKRLRKLGISPTILISGDLMVGLLATFLLKRLLARNILTQVSVHGSVTRINASKKSWPIDLIRILLLHIFLAKTDSIRVVSSFLADELHERFKVKDSKFFIAPIPFLDYPNFAVRSSKRISIGFVGRLHFERNVTEALSILDNVLPSNNVSEVFIIGDGPLQNMVQTWAKNHPNKDKIMLIGKLNQVELLKFWPRVDLLLSTASSEGYGLSIREALVSGAVVLAKKNLGTRTVLEQFQSGIVLFDTCIEAIALINNIALNIDLYAPSITSVRVQQEIDRASMNALASSWTST